MPTASPQRLQFIQRYITASIMIRKHLTTLRKSDMSQTGLNKAQLEILYILDSAGPLSMTELAETTNTTSGAVTQIIDGLIKLDFVNKVGDKTDKRKSYIMFSSKGKEKFTRIKSEHLEHWAAILKDVSNLDLQDIAELQEGIAKIIKEAKES